MEVEIRRRLAVDGLEEGPELPGAMARQAFADARRAGSADDRK